MTSFSHQGELAALFAAFCWTVTALNFESAGRRVGSLPVNLIRLVLAFVFLSIYGIWTRGHWIPLDADSTHWTWLLLSGIVGFVIGDLSLFRAFVLIGARLSMLLFASVPIFSALLGWVILDEHLSIWDGLGMALTVGGVSWVVLERKKGEDGRKAALPVTGILLALAGALGQAMGLILSKYGMRDFDPFAATQIRVVAGIFGFSILFSILGRWKPTFDAIRNVPAMKRIVAGSFFGPFLGVSLSLMAIQYTQTGVAATIMALVPVLIIPPAILLFKENVSFRAVFGAILAVSGAAILFLQ